MALSRRGRYLPLLSAAGEARYRRGRVMVLGCLSAYAAGEQQCMRGNGEQKGWRAGPPALAENSYGCFLPDLTRFTTMQCGAARR